MRTEDILADNMIQKVSYLVKDQNFWVLAND